MGYSIYGLSGEKGENIYQHRFASKGIFVLGNETQGVSEATEACTYTHLSIPMFQGVESLNVACAATIVASEIARNRASF